MLLLRGAPALRELYADYACALRDQAVAMLRNEPPYGPLRLRTLVVQLGHRDDDEGEAAVASIAAALPAHTSLRCLVLSGARLQSDAACGALVDAALALRLPTLELDSHTAVSPAFTFALARLLRGGSLTGLRIDKCHNLLEAPAATAALAAALQDTTTLTSLQLSRVGLWQAQLPGAVLLRALTGHPSLQKLVFRSDKFLTWRLLGWARRLVRWLLPTPPR